MKFTVEPMAEDFAKAVGQWRYPSPYDFYDMNGSEDETVEFLNGSYFSAIDEVGEIVGYCCFGIAAQVPLAHNVGAYRDEELLDIGLGMRPDLTGRGLGRKFLSTLLAFTTKKFDACPLRLTVAEFNARAIHLYQQTGFQQTMRFTARDVMHRVSATER